VTGTAAIIDVATRDLRSSTGACPTEPFATLDVADGIERAAHGAGPGIAVARCSASVGRPETRKEQG
jgi:hypothetical protein